MQTKLGDVPHEVLRGAVDEVIVTLKDDGLKDNERRGEIESAIDRLSDEEFNALTVLAKQIQDFNPEAAGDSNLMQHEEDVAVEFDKEDDSEESDVYAEDGGEGYSKEQISGEEATRGGIQARMESDGEEEAKDDDALDVSEIDAFWL